MSTLTIFSYPFPCSWKAAISRLNVSDNSFDSFDRISNMQSDRMLQTVSGLSCALLQARLVQLIKHLISRNRCTVEWAAFQVSSHICSCNTWTCWFLITSCFHLYTVGSYNKMLGQSSHGPGKAFSSVLKLNLLKSCIIFHHFHQVRCSNDRTRATFCSQQFLPAFHKHTGRNLLLETNSSSSPDRSLNSRTTSNH